MLIMDMAHQVTRFLDCCKRTYLELVLQPWRKVQDLPVERHPAVVWLVVDSNLGWRVPFLFSVNHFGVKQLAKIRAIFVDIPNVTKRHIMLGACQIISNLKLNLCTHKVLHFFPCLCCIRHFYMKGQGRASVLMNIFNHLFYQVIHLVVYPYRLRMPHV